VADSNNDASGGVDVAAARIVTRHETQLLVIRTVRLVLVVAVSYLPLVPLRDSIVALAGETTSVSGILNVSVYAGLTLTATLGGAGWKVFAQRNELKKLRKRVEGLEAENKRLRKASQGSRGRKKGSR
jgi:hypothetical protein